MKVRLAVAMGVALVVTTRAAAQTVVVNDGFDNYANQAAFEAVWVPIGGGTPPGSLGVIGGTLSTAQAVSPTFSVLNHSPAVPTGVTEPSTSAYSQRNQLTFTESGAISTTVGIRFSFDFYDLAPTLSPYRQFVNLQDSTAPTNSNQLVGLGMNNNQLGTVSGGQYYMARILGYSPPAVDPDGGPGEAGTLGSGAFFKLNDFGAPHRTTGWHNLKAELTTDDGLSTDYAFYVDNVLCEKVSDFSTAATFRSYDVLRMGSGNSSGTDGYYDNMKVETFLIAPPVTFNSDFNNDGTVTGEDFLLWQAGYQKTGETGKLHGDADGDHDVTSLDYDAWVAHFGGAPAAAAGAQVPEPCAVGLAVVALAGLAAARRQASI